MQFRGRHAARAQPAILTARLSVRSLLDCYIFCDITIMIIIKQQNGQTNLKMSTDQCMFSFNPCAFGRHLVLIMLVRLCTKPASAAPYCSKYVYHGVPTAFKDLCKKKAAVPLKVCWWGLHLVCILLLASTTLNFYCDRALKLT